MTAPSRSLPWSCTSVKSMCSRSPGTLGLMSFKSIFLTVFCLAILASAEASSSSSSSPGMGSMLSPASVCSSMHSSRPAFSFLDKEGGFGLSGSLGELRAYSFMKSLHMISSMSTLYFWPMARERCTSGSSSSRNLTRLWSSASVCVDLFLRVLPSLLCLASCFALMSLSNTPIASDASARFSGFTWKSTTKSQTGSVVWCCVGLR
mmetsp:Transcript_10971/g.22874  ORF Transcript_10971/g.22874 Transcript_10971/m.22874 type:complete len:206 (-) Transcript_10971:3101-3718(-)